MFTLNKTVVITVLTFSFLITCCLPAWSGKGEVSLTYKGESVSADLDGVALESILEELSRKHGIWFKVHKSVVDQNISVRFKELSFEEALKRILGRLDYSLVFDNAGRPTGAVVVGKKTPVYAMGKRPAARDSRTEPLNLNESGEGSKSGPIPGDAPVLSAEELEEFKVIKNCPPPGGDTELTEEELEKFKVIKNCPPPGGLAEVPAEELENFKVIKNSSPDS
jgi:hypothetical protein